MYCCTRYHHVGGELLAGTAIVQTVRELCRRVRLAAGENKRNTLKFAYRTWNRCESRGHLIEQRTNGIRFTNRPRKRTPSDAASNAWSFFDRITREGKDKHNRPCDVHGYRRRPLLLDCAPKAWQEDLRTRIIWRGSATNGFVASARSYLPGKKIAIQTKTLFTAKRKCSGPYGVLTVRKITREQRRAELEKIKEETPRPTRIRRFDRNVI
jgi:hypothetical protein